MNNTKKRGAPAVIDGEPVPNVNRRQMLTIWAMADAAMEWIPSESFDLSDPGVREAFRTLMRQAIGTAAHEIEWAYRRATDSALTQASDLMRDPQRYANQKQRRAEQKARRVAREAERLANIEKHRRWNAEAGIESDDAKGSKDDTAN